MRSGTSFFDWTVFKKTVTRFWPIWAVYFAIWAFALPLSGLMALSQKSTAYWAGLEISSIERFARVNVTGLEVMSLFMAAAFGLMAAMAVFSHLYNSRSANFFGALPIRREGLFLTHYLAGLSFLIVPNVVIFLLALAVEAAGGVVGVGMQALLFWLGVACGESFFFYTFAVVFAQLAGHILAVPVFYAVGNVLAGGVYGAVDAICGIFYYGFSGMPEESGEVVMWFMPGYRLMRSVGANWIYVRNWEGLITGADELAIYGMDTVAIYAVVAVVLAVIAFLLYRVRRQESAGDVVAVKVMRPVFRYGVAVCGGVALGFLTTLVLSLKAGGFMVSVVIWAVVSCFVAQMLLDKSFRVFGKWKGSLAVGLAFCALFAVMAFDLTGFETRVPDPANVASVEVRGLDTVWYRDSGDYVELELTDPGQIALIAALHEEGVRMREPSYPYDTYGSTESGATYSCTLRLTYHLKNGSTMSRKYYLLIPESYVDKEGSASWILEQLYADRDLYWRVYGFDQIHEVLDNGGRLDEVYCDLEDSTGPAYQRTERYFYGGDAAALLAAVEEDYWAGNIGLRHVTDGDGYNETDVRRRLTFSTNAVTVHTNTDAAVRYAYVTILVPDTAEKTLAVLGQVWDSGVDPSADYNMYDDYVDDAPAALPETSDIAAAWPSSEPVPPASGVE